MDHIDFAEILNAQMYFAKAKKGTPEYEEWLRKFKEKRAAKSTSKPESKPKPTKSEAKSESPKKEAAKTQLSDNELISQAINGSQRAQNQLYTKYQKTVLDTVKSKIDDPEIAEDVAADTWVKLYSNGLSKFSNATNDGNMTFKDWIKTTARNTALDYLRSSQHAFNVNKKQHNPSDDEGDEMGDDNYYYDGNNGDTFDSPEQSAIKADVSKELKRALSTLSPTYRDTLIAHIVEGKTAAEIAKDEGISVSGANARLKDAMKKLRAAVDPEMLKAYDAFILNLQKAFLNRELLQKAQSNQ